MEKKLINTRCPWCGQYSAIQVSTDGFNKWQSGALIQNAFPELSPDQREQLITGMCPRCWNATFR